MKVRIDFKEVPAELLPGLRAIAAEFPERFAGGGLDVSFARHGSEESWRIEGGPGAGIGYARPIDAFRALGRVFGLDALPGQSEGETAAFTMLGAMIDVSRNGVLTVRAAKSLLCRFALMGINTVLLYTEDVYQVEGEPFWGYLRGAYGEEELRELDGFAADLGIEMIPCIQTLAHLEQVLQWPAYWEIRDTERVLMADEERTYELIGKLIATVARCFRSRRVHLGMDEAHGIGKGNYLKKHGEKTAFAILQDHLKRVGELCRLHGLRPMIWSDMYFRLGSAGHDYYDPETVIPDWVRETIPQDVELVYWDYYHLDRSFYLDWIDRHRQLGKEPLLAPGTWTWNRLWAALPFAFAAMDAAMAAARERGLREAFVTAWGDDGTECDPFSMLPALQRFADHGYREGIDERRLAENFSGSCGGVFENWVRASDVDAPGGRDDVPDFSNLGKLLLWQDPVLAIYDPLVDPVDFSRHYQALAEQLEAAAASGGSESRLLFPARLARVLELKCGFRFDLVGAYERQDRARLKALAEVHLPELRRAVDKLWRSHRTMWMETFKPFGWEVIEGRYGRLRSRLETVGDRLQEYLAGQLASLPELEVKLERLETESGLPFDHSRHGRAATPSWIK
jgi:hexosaminidase